MRIYLDPGHGGYDPGAIGPGGTQEADVNLSVSLRVAELLRQAGQEVRLTRDSDQTPWGKNNDLSTRCVLANNWAADYFVSIHCNSAAGPYAHGTETYCYKFGGKGEQLARAIQGELIQATGLKDRGVKEANFYVLRGTNMPAILVELAFISNSQEEQLLADEGFQEKCAQAIARGILKYLGIGIQQPSVQQPGDWKRQLVDRALQRGWLTQDHDPDEDVKLWTLLAVLENALGVKQNV